MTDHENAASDHERRRTIELEQALLRERRRVAEEHRRYAAAMQELANRPSHEQLVAAQKEVKRLQRRLDSVFTSRTWKAGRALWRLAHLPSSIWRRGREAPVAAGLGDTPATAGAGPTAVPPADYSLVDDSIVKEKYHKALDRRAFTAAGTGRNVVMAVYTTDLDAGRGDLYTAIGLGRNLERIGYEVIYLSHDRWYEVPPHTDLYVAYLETVDLTRLPRDVTAVAWIRNQTEAWLRQPWLHWYDVVLCSSQQSLDAVQDAYLGATGLLPIGVDTELFNLKGRIEDRVGVVSTVNQWGRERQLFTALEGAEPDCALALFGIQRGVPEVLGRHGRGPVSFFALPSLYNEAQVVLDDFNHTTVGYGNVNSRVFEAAACGAVVITNRAAELESLDDLPVYESAEQLHDLIQASLHSTDLAKGAEARSQQIIEHHSYRVRAEQFRDLVENRTAVADDRIVIGSYPGYTDNPYSEMMWSVLRSRGAIDWQLGDDLDFGPLLEAAQNRRTVFHLNWTAPILGPGVTAAERRIRYDTFLAGLDRLAEQGVPTIWTIHNVLPHETADPELERRLRQELADRVDIVHVMCAETVSICAGFFSIPPSKIRVIPHPSYVDVYPNLVDQQTARYELGLGHDDFVYLYLGQVRPYKGVDLLLDAFDRVARLRPDSRLLIAGKPGRFAEMDEIRQRARAHPQVLSSFNEVADGDIQLYMNAADVVVLPYRSGLNSGALHLAYSFGRPVVVSEVGCMGNQVDATTGITFRTEDGSQSLTDAMLAALQLGREEGEAGYRRAQQNHYLEISRQFGALVKELLPPAG